MERTGYLCLRRLADYFGIQYDHDPRPDDPISITRREFDLVVVELQAAGLPLKQISIRPGETSRAGVSTTTPCCSSWPPSCSRRRHAGSRTGVRPPSRRSSGVRRGGVTPGTESRNDGSSSK